ncbi:MAG: hypothetical protein ACLUW6_00895 [Coriobacteriaceae bacterium]
MNPTVSEQENSDLSSPSPAPPTTSPWSMAAAEISEEDMLAAMTFGRGHRRLLREAGRLLPR